MDVPVGNLLVLFVLALAGLAVVMGVVARAFVDHRRGLGYALGVLFVLAWLVSLGFWRFGRVEEKWSARLQHTDSAAS